MELDAAQEFLRANHRAVLVTSRADGRPQTSPVMATVDDQGRVLVSTRETAMKAKNLERRPAVSLCVLSERFYGPWIQVDGDAEVIHRPEAVDLLVDYYRRISGEHPDWDEYRSAMEREGRVLLRITITDAGPDRSG